MINLFRTNSLKVITIFAILVIPTLGYVNAQSDNPFMPTSLNSIATALQSAIQGKGDPANTPLALVTNDLSPFWTAGQIGSQRAASEIGAPVILNAPRKPGDKLAQKKIVQSFIDDGYKGIAFSAIDPVSIESTVTDGIAKGINFITFDSDASNTKRLLYLGTDNYKAGVSAGKALLQALGDKGGKVVGLVGAMTAQNAIDRVQGITDALKDSNVTLSTVMVDDLDPLKAENNAENALLQYPDLAAFVGIYSYDGPAAGKALKVTNVVGKVKIVAFDLAPETIALLKEGTVSAAIGQRPYYMGYLSVYILYSAATLGKDETMLLLSPYLSGNNNDIIDTGVDIVTADTLPVYSQYLNSIGIKSQ
jgi:ribose transport system substrate-binding protein